MLFTKLIVFAILDLNKQRWKSDIMCRGSCGSVSVTDPTGASFGLSISGAVLPWCFNLVSFPISIRLGGRHWIDCWIIEWPLACSPNRCPKTMVVSVIFTIARFLWSDFVLRWFSLFFLFLGDKANLFHSCISVCRNSSWTETSFYCFVVSWKIIGSLISVFSYALQSFFVIASALNCTSGGIFSSALLIWVTGSVSAT